MEYVLQQLWIVIGLMAFIVGAMFWRRQHMPATASRTPARPPAPIVYRDTPTVRVADAQRVDRTRKLLKIAVGRSVDVLPTPPGLPPRFRIHVKSIVDGSDLEAAHIGIEFSGVQLGCGPLVDETAFNEFVIPRATRDEHRSSVFYYHERGESLELVRIRLKSADLANRQVELDVMQLHGHWPTGYTT